MSGDVPALVGDVCVVRGGWRSEDIDGGGGEVGATVAHCMHRCGIKCTASIAILGDTQYTPCDQEKWVSRGVWQHRWVGPWVHATLRARERHTREAGHGWKGSARVVCVCVCVCAM